MLSRPVILRATTALAKQMVRTLSIAQPASIYSLSFPRRTFTYGSGIPHQPRSLFLNSHPSYAPRSFHRPGTYNSCNYSSKNTSKPSRKKYPRRLGYAALVLGLGWGADREFNASAIGRNLKTVWTCAVIALDYKLNFTPENSEGIPAIHERVADRIFDLFTSNGGLYIKIGQAIANNSAVLPPAMQVKFAKLFDDAPQIPYSVVLSVFESEFHQPPSGPDGVFEYFDENAVASASIAQVHKAKLKEADGGGWVAVKVQKPALGKQVELDLGVFRIVMWMYENWLFHVPTYFIVDFISDHLRRELDFLQEAENANITASFVKEEPRLRDRVYVPKVYKQYTTKKVMTAEWIDGIRMSDRVGIKRLMGEIPSTFGMPSSPLKGGTPAILQTMVELFSAQIFQWGWVHCDPHPGNIIIRPHPSDPTRPQFVLLDHGLYVRAAPNFQRQYATLWKGLMTMDYAVIRGVAGEWGIGAPDIFASATLMRPIKFADAGDKEKDGNAERKPIEEMDNYERSVVMKEKLKNFLTDTDKMPKELVFIGRNMRIVQGNNQMFGSPVNRIKITGEWASRSLTTTPNLSFIQWARECYGYFLFKTVMFTLDLAFWIARVRQWWRGGKDNEGFEDELEKTMRAFAKGNFGLEINEGAIYSG